MAPLTSTQVLPDGWSDHHRPAAEGFLTGQCRAERPAPPQDWEPGADAPANQSGKIWSRLACSVQILSQAVRPVRVTDSVEVQATHRVSVPITAVPLRYKDYFTILDNPDDPALNGRKLTVLVIESVTTNWTREYLCQEVNSE